MDDAIERPEELSREDLAHPEEWFCAWRFTLRK